MRCERCSKIFEQAEEKDVFDMETLKDYNNLRINLCANCAIEAINNLESNVYFEYCEKCGKQYDPIEDETKFESIYSNEYGSYASINEVSDMGLCLDCAIDEYKAGR